MSNNEIVVTLKGKDHNDPWVVVHADNPQLADQALDFLDGDFFAKLHSTNQIFQASGATVQVTHPQATAASPPPAQSSWGAPAVESPSASQPAPNPQSGGVPDHDASGTPIWIAADPNKPQYQAVWFKVPYIKDKATRDGYLGELKNVTWAKFNAEAEAWFAAKKHEQFIRDHIAKGEAAGIFNG